MSTYRYGRWKSWDGVTFYNIEKKVLFGWREEKYWVVSRVNGMVPVRDEDEIKKEMMESVDRLVKAGHTVL